jgi:hypothetical protein
VPGGSDQSFSITANAGYHIADVTVDEISVGAVTAYSFTNISANHTISVGFALNTNALVVSKNISGTGSRTERRAGTIVSEPSGINCGNDCTEEFNAGTEVTLTALIGENSIFTGWSGACTGTGACTVIMDELKNVIAGFAVNTYNITSSADTGGTISPAGNVIVNAGSDQTFIITSDEGYQISALTVDGVSVRLLARYASGAVTRYTFANVTSSHTINATFVPSASDKHVCLSGCQYTSLQAAIDEAVLGDVIKVAAGVYHENIVISTSMDISIQGGWDDTFAVRADDPALTTIDGDVNADGVGDSSVIMLTADAGMNISAVVENISLTNGYADNGGAVQLMANSGTVQLAVLNSIIAGNSATYGGGISALAINAGATRLTLKNNMIVENTAAHGGGVDFYSADPGSRMTIIETNNTITSNSASVGGGLHVVSERSGHISVTGRNEIIWGNEAGGGSDLFLYQDGSRTDVQLTASDIGSVINDPSHTGFGSYTQDINSINADPGFINPGLGDYRLSAESPCRDAGTQTGSPLTDIIGQARPQGNGVDIGAVEYAALP